MGSRCSEGQKPAGAGAARPGLQEGKQISSPSWQPASHFIFSFPSCSFTDLLFWKPTPPHQHTRAHLLTRVWWSPPTGGVRGVLSFVERAPLRQPLKPFAAPPSSFLHVVRWRSDLDVISFVSALETKQCVTTLDKIWYWAEKKPYRKMWLIDTQGREKPTTLIAPFHLTCPGPLGALLIH